MPEVTSDPSSRMTIGMERSRLGWGLARPALADENWVMPDPDPLPDAPDDIEVGAAEGDLRYWLAKEAMRQGEARLASQNAVRTALEARATALTGWGAIGLLATAGASFTARDSAAFLGATAAAVVLFVAASLGIYAVRPRDWSMVGYEPDVMTGLSSRFATELEAVEHVCTGLTDGIFINNKRITRTGQILRLAGWLLIMAPIVGAAVYRIRLALTGWW